MDKLIDMLDSAGLDIHGIEIIKNGETVLHHCPGGEKRYPIYSAAKSITSAAFALACDNGATSADMPLADLLESRYRNSAPKGFNDLPFSRFLTMTAGAYPFRPEGDDWLKYILSHNIDYSDTSFHYSNIPAYLVGAAVENAVGGDLMSYLNKRLFEPLGITTPPYSTCPQGHFYGATGMELYVHELALLGQLFLQNGKFNGEQIISVKSVSEAIAPRVDTGSGDSYGYFFRVADDHFSMVGKWGQRCMMFPENNQIVAYLSHQPERSNELYELIKGFVRSAET